MLRRRTIDFKDSLVESLVAISSTDSGGDKLRERKSLNFRNDRSALDPGRYYHGWPWAGEKSKCL